MRARAPPTAGPSHLLPSAPVDGSLALLSELGFGGKGDGDGEGDGVATSANVKVVTVAPLVTPSSVCVARISCEPGVRVPSIAMAHEPSSPTMAESATTSASPSVPAAAASLFSSTPSRAKSTVAPAIPVPVIAVGAASREDPSAGLEIVGASTGAGVGVGGGGIEQREV